MIDPGAPFFDPRVFRNLASRAQRQARKLDADADNISHRNRNIYPTGSLLDAAELLQECASALNRIAAIIAAAQVLATTKASVSEG